MKERRFIKCLILVAAILMTTFSVMASGNGSSETEYKNVKFRYNDGASDTTQTNQFVYYDEILMTDANILSKELAKVSAALSVAAYNPVTINSVLDQMGYECFDNSAAYAQLDDFTILNNDHVAYTIATNEITFDGKDYLVYCVPVKGTGANAEWFSNFNIGISGTHEGFRNAASEIRADLFDLFAEDGYTSDQRILWFTGHSRGGAVANLLAGWFTEDQIYAKRENIFGLTFACPAVSKKASTTMTNIYNFNNAGDLVTMVPYTSWDYKRYGIDVALEGNDPNDLPIIENIRQQYPIVLGDEFTSATTSENWEEILEAIVEKEEDFLNPKVKLTFALLAYSMGGHNQATLPEVLAYVGYESVDDICSSINNLTLDKVFSEVVAKGNEYHALLDFVETTLTEDMTPEEWENYKKTHEEQINQIEEIVGTLIESIEDLNIATKILSELYSFSSTMNDIDENIVSLFYDTTGNYDLLNSVKRGHTQATYLMWINASYYGYRGWYQNDDIQAVDVGNNDRIYTIGEQCFAECSNLAWAKINDQIGYIGDVAFDGCSSMKEITLPVDYRVEGNCFRRCTGVEQIHYTCGKTGVMPDRSDDNDFPNHFSNTLEHACISRLKQIDFEEGITGIGDYAYYNNSGLTEGVLETVTLPESLKSIGDGAFYEQTMIGDLQLPENVTFLGTQCFMYSSGLTSINLPEGLTEIPDDCFYQCSSLESIVIPDNIISLGKSAFADCDGLREVTLPVDYDFSNKPFTSTTGVKTIHYTYGQSGVMRDRTDNTGMKSDYSHTLEYISIYNLKNIDFADEITRIGDYAYYNYLGNHSGILENVELPECLESIGKCAFFDQSMIGDVVLPETVTSLGDSCFMYSSGLTAINIPSGVKTIPENCFNQCTALTSIVIPDSVTNLAKGSFASCRGLVEVTLPVDYNFSNIPFTSTTGVKKIHYTYGRIGVMPDREKNSSYSNYYTKSLEYNSRFALTTVDFEEGITEIGEYAFYNGLNATVKLTEIKLPSTLKTIKGSAFYGQKALEEIVIPTSVKTIEEYAFYTCNALKKVYYCGTEMQWSEISIGRTNNLLKEDLTYHKWDEGKITKPATVKEEGVFTYTCMLCHGTREEVIEKPTPVTSIFTDVQEGSWHVEAVQYVYDNGIMTGVGDITFDPETAVTRATIVQTLYKMEGKPAVSDFTKYNNLNDTLDDIWWKNGLAWALNEGVAKGDSTNNIFKPDEKVTREDLATFIYRYAQYKGVNVELEGSVDEILGDTFVNSWAKKAFAWAIEEGLIKGKTINGVSDLAPQTGATRAELATIMMRFYKKNNL